MAVVNELRARNGAHVKMRDDVTALLSQEEGERRWTRSADITKQVYINLALRGEVWTEEDGELELVIIK